MKTLFEHRTNSWFKKSHRLVSSIILFLHIVDASALRAKRHLLWVVGCFHSCYFYAKSQRVLTFALQRYSFFLIYARNEGNFSLEDGRKCLQYAAMRLEVIGRRHKRSVECRVYPGIQQFSNIYTYTRVRVKV